MRHYGGSSYPLIIITQRFYRQLIAILKVIANFSNVSNLREDNFASGATDYDGEKYFICLWKFNSQGVLGEGGGGRYGEQLAYLGYLLVILYTGKGNMGKPALMVH